MMTSSITTYLQALLLIIIICCCSLVLGFVPPSASQRTKCITHINTKGSNNNAHTTTQLYTTNDTTTLYPVISKIAGKEWTGTCRYINSDLQHATNLQLFGGVKYEISHDDNNNNKLTLSSFLTFPNGKTRQVVMQGERSSKDDDSTITLRPVEDNGPIIMKLSEIKPDTILINEVEKESGRIIMTSSVTVVQTMRGTELIGVSHEVGDVNKDTAIEGHQLWRMMDRSGLKEVSLSREFE